MADNFYMSGLDDGWFSNNFERFHLFGYVGDRERLQKAIQEKSMFRRLVELVAPSINIGTILNALATFDLVRVDPDKTLATRIINFVTEGENNRKLTELLAQVYKRARSDGRYFERVSKRDKASIFRADFNGLQDRLVTVEGQILHRSAVSQFSRDLHATLGASHGEWVMGDFPPHALVAANSRFDGKVLLLSEDRGFTDTFSQHLPFCRGLAWYPYVRVTGVFDGSRLQTEILPSLSVSLVEYRRPKIFREVRESVLGFATGELHRRRIRLDEWSDLILFSYLLPLLFKGSNLEASDADPPLAELLHNYYKEVEKDVPVALGTFYSRLPVAGAG